MDGFDFNKGLESVLGSVNGFFDRKFLSESSADQVRFYQGLLNQSNSPPESAGPAPNTVVRNEASGISGIPTWALVAGAGVAAYLVLSK